MQILKYFEGYRKHAQAKRRHVKLQPMLQKMGFAQLAREDETGAGKLRKTKVIFCEDWKGYTIAHSVHTPHENIIIRNYRYRRAERPRAERALA